MLGQHYPQELPHLCWVSTELCLELVCFAACFCINGYKVHPLHSILTVIILGLEDDFPILIQCLVVSLGNKVVLRVFCDDNCQDMDAVKGV